MKETEYSTNKPGYPVNATGCRGIRHRNSGSPATLSKKECTQ